MSGAGELPVLWQYSFSNYNEKARWALDLKQVPHRRRSLMPAEPMAMRFTLRGTLPVLDLEGRRYGDSTEIVAALERLRPDPPLYPAAERERARALALEDWLDEEVGHALRRALFWELRDDRDAFVEFIAFDQPAAKRAWLRAGFPLGWLYVRRRYAFYEADAEAAWGTLEAALDRLEAERDGGPYLVGERFTIADLTAASLLWPLPWPPELPYDYPALPPIDRLDHLREHPATAWLGELYARHRGRSSEVS